MWWGCMRVHESVMPNPTSHMQCFFMDLWIGYDSACAAAGHMGQRQPPYLIVAEQLVHQMCSQTLVQIVGERGWPLHSMHACFACFNTLSGMSEQG